jgi:hypothetical protein
MRKISPKVKEILLQRQSRCVRENEGTCAGKITWEHSLIYAGRQIDEAWAIIFLCEYHHDVNMYQDCGDLQKELNVYYALNQATDEELKKYSKAIDYIAMKKRLKLKYDKK